MNENSIVARDIALFDAAETGNYPEGTTVQDLIEAVHDTAIAKAQIRPGWPQMAATGHTALHIAAFHGHLLPGTTIQHLMETKSDWNGWTALHHAAKGNHIPAQTTVQDLVAVRTTFGRTALHEMALRGNFIHGITTRILADTKDSEGWSALHDAAIRGNLPPDVTLNDLDDCVDDNGLTAFMQLKMESVSTWLPVLLENTKARNSKEIQTIGDRLKALDGVKVNNWVLREMKRVNRMKSLCR